MKKVLIPIFVVILTMVFAVGAFAGMKEDAQALVESAVAMVKDKGLDATLTAIKDKSGPFIKGDLYIFVGKLDKVEIIVHPINPKLEGRDMSKMKDVKGKYFFMEFVNKAKDPGTGWVEYHWPKPGEKKPSPKDTYIMRVPGEEVWFGCGYYK